VITQFGNTDPLFVTATISAAAALLQVLRMVGWAKTQQQQKKEAANLKWKRRWNTTQV
jgi:hypothetical protein